MIPEDRTFEDLRTVDVAVFEHSFTAADVADFARLTGDENPIHMDDAYAQSTRFGKRLVHGLLVGALCSRLVGMHLPGKRCLYHRHMLTGFHRRCARRAWHDCSQKQIDAYCYD